MIKKKEINLDLLAKTALKKALQEHGMLDEAQKTSVLTPTDIQINPKEWGKGHKTKPPTPSDLGYFTQKLRELAGAGASVEDLSKILEKLNNILGFYETQGVTREKKKTENNVNEIITAVYITNVMNHIASKFGPQSGGGVWESFMANLLGGKTARVGKQAPIQDYYDGEGNFISQKLIKKGSPIVGSKLNLAIGIAKAEKKGKEPKVTYIITEKSSEKEPYKLTFKKFVVTKENYFSFIAKSKDGAIQKGELKGAAREFVTNYLKSKDMKVDEPETGAKSDIKQEPEGDLSLDDLVLNDLRDKNQQSDNEQLVKIAKNNFKQKIRELASSFEDTGQLEKFRKLFKRFDPEDKKIIKFPGTVGKDKKYEKYSTVIDLTSKDGFIDTMEKFWLYPDDNNKKIFKESAFDEFVYTIINDAIPKFEEVEDFTDGADEIIKNIVMFDVPNDPDLKDMHKKFISEVNSLSIPQNIKNEIAQIPFEETIKKYYNYDDDDLQDAIEESYIERRNIYRNQGKILQDDVKKLLKPFVSWFYSYKKEIEDKAQRKSEKAASKIIARAREVVPKKGGLIDTFWQTVANDVPESEEEAPAVTGEGLILETKSSTKFEMALSTISDIVAVTSNFPTVIISTVANKTIAEKNVTLFKEYIEPYNIAFKRMSEGTNKYFVGDDPTGLQEVDQALKSLDQLLSGKNIEGKTPGSIYRKDKQQGAQFIKASELKESLNNLTEEARIVMEMLKRMED